MDLIEGHAIETPEPPQGVFVGNAFAQFPVVPILDAHQNQGAENLPRGQPAPARIGSWRTIVSFESLSRSGSAFRPSCRASGFGTDTKSRRKERKRGPNRKSPKSSGKPRFMTAA